MGIIEWLNEILPTITTNKPKKDNPNPLTLGLSTNNDPNMAKFLGELEAARQYNERRWRSEARARGWTPPPATPYGTQPPETYYVNPLLDAPPPPLYPRLDFLKPQILKR